jgi:GT2 family glycosyltransferase
MNNNFVIKLRTLRSALHRSIHHARTDGLNLWQIVGKGVCSILRGPRGFARRVVAYDQANLMRSFRNEITNDLDGPDHYRQWLEHDEPKVAMLYEGGIISVIMPVCETPARFLREVIASVQAQTYASWELCICDDASTGSHVHAILDEMAKQDSRIKIVYGKARGGISKATNAALELANGAYVVMLDHDDLLHPDALASVAAEIEASQSDIVYTDHDCIDEEGQRKLPFFKPNWTNDLFLSQMYVGHLVAIKRNLLVQVGLFDSEMDGAQDYDLLLRCMARKATVSHVPRVLYHWRQHAGSTAGNADSKPYAHHSGRNAIQRYLDNSHPGAIVKDGAHTFCYDVRYPVPAGAGKVSIIIPTRDGLELLEACVTSLRQKTVFKDYELIIVDNGSKDADTLDWLAKMASQGVVRVIKADVPFNWSYINNLAAKEASGDVLLFLNNDVEIIDSEWLQRLVENALRPEVGVCGPLLLYGDMTIQHAGVVVGLGGWADHVFKGLLPIHVQSNYVSPVLRRNVLAVTGACMAIEKRKFVELGGFDETFIVCGSDVELCLRAFRAGLLNVYVPESRLIHHESKTRDPRNIPAEDFVQSDRAYAPFRLEGDPYYNRNLDTMSCVPLLRSSH